ncbi:MAG: Gfo/Idh/MocA family protein [Candidatus Eremiobacter antarcticus]
MVHASGNVTFAVVGFGYWGPHLVRNILLCEGAGVAWISDQDDARLQEAGRRFPGIRATPSLEEVLCDPGVDVVAIATPVHSHHALALKALREGKHVFIEKPLTASRRQATEILAVAAQFGRRVFVDHTFVFTPAVQKMRQLLLSHELGRPLYYDSVRINLGIFQHDVNVVWDLVTHDIAILDFLLQGTMPVTASCTGTAHFGSQHADLAYLTLAYEDDFIAHINVNWLAPVKVRQVLLCGDRKMVVYDDNSASEKIKVYDSGVNVRQREDIYEMLVQYRVGDMHAPRLETTEALSNEITNVVEALRDGAVAVADGEAGLRVVSILEAADASLRLGGISVPIVPLDLAALLDGKRTQLDGDGLRKTKPHDDLTPSLHR